MKGDEGGILSGIATNTKIGSTGDAGDILFTADSLEVVDGARIDANTLGSGKGGNIEISAQTIQVEGFTRDRAFPIPSEIAALSGPDSEQGGGNVSIDTDRSDIRNGTAV